MKLPKILVAIGTSLMIIGFLGVVYILINFRNGNTINNGIPIIVVSILLFIAGVILVTSFEEES